MKREEEIQQKASEESWYIADTSQTKEEASIRGYCLGAAYADRTMLDRACEWLNDTDFDMEYWNHENGFCKEEFITAFRQAMKDGAEWRLIEK